MNNANNEHNLSLLALWDDSKPESTLEIIKKQSPDITILHNNETGEWLWSIVLTGTDLWLTSFANQKQAKRFVKKHGLLHTIEDQQTGQVFPE